MKVNQPVTQREQTFADGSNLVSLTDLKGVIQYVNSDFIQISGYTADELIGQNHHMIRHPDMPPAAFEDLWATIKANKPWRGMVKNRCKNGDHYWVDAYVTPVFEGPMKVGYQSVRSCPTRKQVEQADALYAKMRANKQLKIPKKTSWNDKSLAIKAGLPSIFMLVLTVLVLSLTQLNLMSLHEQLSTQTEWLHALETASNISPDELSLQVQRHQEQIGLTHQASNRLDTITNVFSGFSLSNVSDIPRHNMGTELGKMQKMP